MAKAKCKRGATYFVVVKNKALNERWDRRTEDKLANLATVNGTKDDDGIPWFWQADLLYWSYEKQADAKAALKRVRAGKVPGVKVSLHTTCNEDLDG